MSYLYSSRYLILFSFLIFLTASAYGYFLAQFFPQEVNVFLNATKEYYSPVAQMTSFEQFLFIAVNNTITLFLVLILGIFFGIFPLIVLFYNGTLLGILAFASKEIFSWKLFLAGTLPHGIIEIPVIILACAIGFRVGESLFQKVLKKERDPKKEFFAALSFFTKILLPLLIFAAAIETFVTARLLNL